jgi:hypothetical protein
MTYRKLLPALSSFAIPMQERGATAPMDERADEATKE